MPEPDPDRQLLPAEKTASLAQLPATDAGALVEVEALGTGVAPAQTRGALTLRGDAARDIRDSLGGAVIELGKTGGRAAAKTTYKLVPSEAASKGLADGSLRWANASKGDASVLIKDKATGRIAGQGELQKVRPSPAKVLGPAAWQAMALATQQHYLVEINEKLASVEKGVGEVMALMDDDKRGILEEAEAFAERTRDRLAGGAELSDPALAELRRNLSAVNRVWFQLRTTVRRRLDDYRSGGAEPRDVESAWDMLLRATHVLAECSALFVALPFGTVEELERVTAEEQERILDAVDAVRAIASELHAAHLHWSAANAEWLLARTRNPVRQAVRRARKTAVPKPQQPPLDYTTAWRASQLAVPPRPPAALLVAVNDDGTVDVAAQPAENDSPA